MLKKLNIITVQPDAPLFQWAVAVQLFNAKELGISKYFKVLIFKSDDEKDQEFNGKWKFLENKFPEAEFHYYRDTENVTQLMGTFNYIPLLRPWTLIQHWTKFPNLKNETIFYIDSDVVFTKYPDFLDRYRDNDINYISPAGSYTNASYFDSKIKDVLPEKLEDYKSVDVLNQAATYCGINRKICEEHNNSTGAAQYLLKNIDVEFWKDVLACSLNVKVYLADINSRFFESEDKGLQSWCSDIWALVWNLWKRGVEVITPEDMNFSWATEYIDSWERNTIYHDASASPDIVTKDGKEFRTFFKKGKKVKLGGSDYYDYMFTYENPLLRTPFDDDLSYVSKELCSSKYVDCIQKTKDFLFK